MNAPTRIKPETATPVDPVATFAEAFVKLQAAIRPAIKDSTNPAFRSKYADLGAVWEAVKQPLTDNGFFIIQATDFDGEHTWLSTVITHVSGESRSCRFPLRTVKPGMQEIGSALTYARRYSLCAMLGVVADEDDDGTLASARPAPKTQAEVIHQGMSPVKDPDIEEGVKNWIAKQGVAIGKCERLPELLQWQDEQEDALHRLLKKHPEGHRKIMDQFEARKKYINAQEKA